MTCQACRAPENTVTSDVKTGTFSIEPSLADVRPSFADLYVTFGGQLRILSWNSLLEGKTVMEPRTTFNSQMVFGTILILAGAAMFLNNWDIVSIGPLWRYWPLLVIGFAVMKFAYAGSRQEEGSAVWTLIIGLWLLVSVLRLWDLGFRETWPAVFIAFGASMLWKNLPSKNSGTVAQEEPHGH